jgi:hypothetical protein
MPAVHQLPYGGSRVAAGADTAMSRRCAKRPDLAAVGVKGVKGVILFLSFIVVRLVAFT